MSGYNIQNVVKDDASQTLGANVVQQTVSRPFRITRGDSTHFRARLICSGVTSASGITAQLQHSCDGGTTWIDVGDRAQSAVVADGGTEIKLIETDTGDAAQLPLYNYARIVVSTGAGDAVTVSAVWITRIV